MRVPASSKNESPLGHPERFMYMSLAHLFARDNISSPGMLVR